jgi:threonine dehydrogenase-like Zn-dependent dehydrogenase
MSLFPCPDRMSFRTGEAPASVIVMLRYSARSWHLPLWRRFASDHPRHEWSGEVIEIGADVRGFKVGERVTGKCG